MARTSPALDHFGRLLMERVRDWCIRELQHEVRTRYRGGSEERAMRPAMEMLSSGQRRALERIVPAFVDTVIHHMVWMFEQEETVRIQVQADGAKSANLAAESDGLAGELYGDDGWIARFSKYPAEWAGIEQRSSDKGG
jgi:hypothetical protein